MKEKRPEANICRGKMSVGEDPIPQDMSPVLDEPSHELFKNRFERVLASMTSRERRVGKLRFGLGDDISIRTPAEIAAALKVRVETVNRYERGFLKTLRLSLSSLR